MKTLLNFILFFLSFEALSQTSGFSILYDEDHEAPWNEDRNYTLGIGFVYSNAIFTKFLKPKWLKFDLPSSINNQVHFNPSIAIIGSAFTPDDLYQKNIIKGDRPYSSLVGLKFSTAVLDLEKDAYQEDNLVVGIIGLNIGKSIQTFIHCNDGDCDYQAPFRPRGWNHQISNGGELTFLYGKSQEWLLTKKKVNNLTARNYFDFKAGYKFNLGYYTNLFATATFRFGFLDSRNWTRNTLPLANFGGLAPGKKQNFYDLRKIEFYFFGNIQPGLMFWNSLLLGQFKRSDYYLRYSQMRKDIVMGNFGLATYIPFDPCNKAFSGIDIQYSINYKTSDIYTVSNYDRTHFWGTIALNLSFQK
jgi:hypothetical protein